MKCKKCNSENFIMIMGRIHVGMYCKDCGAWRQWLSKSEIRKYRLKGIELKKED